jgi:hypothetical protein
MTLENQKNRFGAEGCLSATRQKKHPASMSDDRPPTCAAKDFWGELLLPLSLLLLLLLSSTFPFYKPSITNHQHPTSYSTATALCHPIVDFRLYRYLAVIKYPYRLVISSI